MKMGAYIIVSGEVQGVGYRYFTYQIAHQLGLKGYVRNLWSGDVEVNVEGERGMIEELIKHLKVGPRWSVVKDVKITWKQFEGKYTGFSVEH
jgi:acylphosphatase